jgi:hypothetical protein
MKKPTLSAIAAPVLALGLLSVVACKKDEPPPPPPPPPPPTAAPEPVVVAPEEDAGLDAPEDAPPDVKPTGTGKPADPTGLRACCAALRQNAASMPPPNNMYALQAAAACDGLVASGQGKAALGGLAGMMKGMGLPPACK